MNIQLSGVKLVNKMLIVLVIFGASLVLSAAEEEAKCNEASFRCDDGTCIDSALTCDGAVNCADGSDEDFVLCRSIPCKAGQFQCVYGACVNGTATCNGVQDCADNSDELLLKCRNEVSYFECVNTLSQPNNLFNPFTQLNDCIGQKRPRTCKENPFETWNQPPCREESAPKFDCFQRFFRPQSLFNSFNQIQDCGLKERTCKDGQVIDFQFIKCDGKVHCQDGSDESLETCATDRCFNYQFRCKNGACVNSTALCDGIRNCADGSDELEQLCRSNDKGLCVLPTFPENGYYAADVPNARPGQTIESVHLNYSCHSGYKLVGTESPYCKQGWWSDEAPKCISQCLLNKHPSVEYLCLPKNSSSKEGANECGDLVEDGTAVRPKCREPNYFNTGVLVNMHCIDGVWDHVTVCSPQCGLVSSEGEELVVGGHAVKRGQHPWHAGIYKKTTRPFMQVCGGSLISNTIVISAAHCFWTSTEKQLPASDFAVAVGKLYRPWNDTHDEDAQKSDVKEIKIPARFQGAAANFQEDIALVILATPFEFRTYVRPICVDFDYNFSRRQLHIGAVGMVAGWGLTEEDGMASPVLQVVELPYVDIEECIKNSPAGFTEYITSDKICAGAINGTVRSVCHGDSGGGLVFQAHERGIERYFLRGVVSTAPANDHYCNVRVYTTFTQISKHEEFIKQQL